MKPYLKKYRLKNCLIFIAIIVTSMVQVGTALIHAFALDALIDKDIINFIQWYGLDFLLWMAYIFGSYGLDIFKMNVIQEMISDMRYDFAKKMTVKSFSEYQKKDASAYGSVLNNDMNLIETAGFQNIYNLVSAISLTLFSLLTLLSFDIRIMIITIVMALVITGFPKLLTPKITKATDAYSKKNEIFLTKVYDIINGYSTLYYLGNKNRVMEQIFNTSQKYKAAKVAYVKKSGFVNSIIMMISILAQIIIVGFSGYLSYVGVISLGIMSSIGNIAGTVFTSLSSFNQYFISIKSVRPLVEKINMSNNETEKLERSHVILDEFATLSIQNLNFGFEEQKVFDNFNLALTNGKNYAIIGSSGSGKSTLINIILGNYKDYEGNVLFNNFELKDIDENELIKQISFVGNNVHIYQDTLFNNISLWDNFSEKEVKQALKQAGLPEFLNKLDEMIDSKELSEGQKQRIGIARAFLRNKKILIFDEAVANLDIQNMLMIENQILEDQDITYITITHHLKDERKILFDEVITISNI